MGKKMRIIIPMAGSGKRFLDAGYKQNKAILPMVYRKTGELCPMVVCSVKDLPGINLNGSNIVFIMRDFHIEDGVDNEIKKWFPEAKMIAISHLTEGQACTCLLAEKFIDSDDLLIAACDNGIEYNKEEFERLRADNDFIVFTSRHDPRTSEHPDSFGWVRIDNNRKIIGVSVKKRISDSPDNDHAIVGTFWFKKGEIFINAAKRMIKNNDRINNEFYVDEVVKHVLEMGFSGSVFEVNRFFNYGEPIDYENYCKKINYYKDFVRSPFFMEG